MRGLAFLVGALALFAVAGRPSPQVERRSRPRVAMAAPSLEPVQLPPVRVPAVASGAFALGAFAIGALAIGALAIGALAVGRLEIRKARLREVEIGDLMVRRFRIADEPPPPGTA